MYMEFSKQNFENDDKSANIVSYLLNFFLKFPNKFWPISRWIHFCKQLYKQSVFLYVNLKMLKSKNTTDDKTKQNFTKLKFAEKLYHLINS